MAVLVATDFTGSDGSSWPTPWTIVSGSGEIQSNRGTQTSPAQEWSFSEHRANISFNDGTVVATVRFSDLSNIGNRINVRWDPLTGNGYRLIVAPEWNGMQLMRVTGWAETILGERYDLAWAADTDYKIKIEFNGSSISARRWQGAEEPIEWDLSAADSTYNSGDVSLVTTSLGVAEAVLGTWDDITIDSLVTSPPVVPSVLVNPERGFYLYTETHENNDGSGRSPLSVGYLQAQRAAGHTVVFRYYVMEKFMNTDTIDQSYLDFIAADIVTARSAGVKLVPRFTYSNSGVMTPPYNADPPRARIISHIEQLAPTLNSGADVIDAIQAGFIGMWGEWYYTDNFGDLGSVTSEQWADRKAVVDALFDNLDQRIFVLVRYVGAMRRLIDAEPLNNDYINRLGHHNDAFLAETHDWGTYETFSDGYTAAQNRAWLANRHQTGRFPMVGETANLNPPRSGLATAMAEMSEYRWSSLNPSYHPDVLSSWGQAGRDEVAERLGYRPVLEGLTIDGSVSPGGQVNVSVQIRNDGWAAPYRARPVQVVFVDGGQVVTRDLPSDFRDLEPQVVTNFSGSVVAPPTEGSYSVYLLIPDASPSLRGNPLYSVILDGAEFDDVTGRNSTGQTVVVSGAVVPSTTVVERWDGSTLIPVVSERWDGSTLIPLKYDS